MVSTETIFNHDKAKSIIGTTMMLLAKIKKFSFSRLSDNNKKTFFASYFKHKYIAPRNFLKVCYNLLQQLIKIHFYDATSHTFSFSTSMLKSKVI